MEKRETDVFDVAVIGGGIGGMETAIEASKRGHKVDLYEKSDRLGGVFNAAAALSFKEKDKLLLKYYARQLEKSGTTVHMNTEITGHKLFTLLHDIQYRVGVAWQNNCYNQPCYPKFYYASDMDWADVLPGLEKKT